MTKVGFKVIDEYTIMYDFDVHKLVAKVNLCHEKGWRLHGSMVINKSGLMCQPLTKTKTIELAEEDLKE